MIIYCAGSTEATSYAAARLQESGRTVVREPGVDVDILLLDVPSFGVNGQLRGGGDIRPILEKLPSNVMVCGGNLNHPELAGYAALDLLRDAGYLAQNAYITAEAALDVALPYLSVTIRDCPVLILGWGRIGKCLAQLLKSIGAKITVAARKETDRAMLSAMGYEAVSMQAAADRLGCFRLIFNTAPEMIWDAERMALCRSDCVKIDLASRPGIAGDDVIIARGLPAIHFPESSGRLIADTVIRLTRKEESS